VCGQIPVLSKHQGRASGVKRVVSVPEIDRSSTTERVADALRAMLFSGELSPGEPLREIGLADAFQVARSTVREALQVLAAEGLVTRFPNRGVTVTALTAHDVAEIFGARLVLETAGVRAGAAGADLAPATEAMDRYARASAGRDRVEATRAHLQFHTSLVGLLGNARLLAGAESLTADLRLALATVERQRGNARQQVADHRRLLRLVKAGDTRRAVAELSRHLSAAQASVAAQMGATQT
jgi:DNA-binding GntR family transcriptional regulator